MVVEPKFLAPKEDLKIVGEKKIPVRMLSGIEWNRLQRFCLDLTDLAATVLTFQCGKFLLRPYQYKFMELAINCESSVLNKGESKNPHFNEFLCPICLTLTTDPVVTPQGIVSGIQSSFQLRLNLVQILI